ncbi:hypothetical protein ACGFJ4_14600 [Micromonospora chalcea]|uniref:hypothetical protein n=1 Tax=Micromonospora chalcea TaxID=1874 RepID=UPI0033E30509
MRGLTGSLVGRGEQVAGVHPELRGGFTLGVSFFPVLAEQGNQGVRKSDTASTGP